MSKYIVASCNDCVLATDTMHDTYCGILMANSVDDDEFTIEEPSDAPPARCPLRDGKITVKLAKGM